MTPNNNLSSWYTCTNQHVHQAAFSEQLIAPCPQEAAADEADDSLGSCIRTNNKEQTGTSQMMCEQLSTRSSKKMYIVNEDEADRLELPSIRSIKAPELVDQQGHQELLPVPPVDTNSLNQVDYDTDDCSLGSLGNINQMNHDFILRPPQAVFFKTNDLVSSNNSNSSCYGNNENVRLMKSSDQWQVFSPMGKVHSKGSSIVEPIRESTIVTSCSKVNVGRPHRVFLKPRMQPNYSSQFY